MPYNRYLNGVIRQPHFQDDVVGNDELSGNHPKHLSFKYDFSVDGGTAGAIVVNGADGVALTIPENAIVTSAIIEVETAVTSGGSATVAFGILGNTDAFLGATGKASLTLDAVLAGNNDLPIKSAIASQVVFTIATADLTAGVIYLNVEYIEGN